MGLFKRKRIYKVEFKDGWNDYGCFVVKATDPAKAWQAARRLETGVYQPTICLNITELTEA